MYIIKVVKLANFDEFQILKSRGNPFCDAAGHELSHFMREEHLGF